MTDSISDAVEITPIVFASRMAAGEQLNAWIEAAGLQLPERDAGSGRGFHCCYSTPFVRPTATAFANPANTTGT